MYRSVGLAIVLLVTLALLAACGGTAPTPTRTAAPTATPTPTAAFGNKPVVTSFTRGADSFTTYIAVKWTAPRPPIHLDTLKVRATDDHANEYVGSSRERAHDLPAIINLPSGFVYTVPVTVKIPNAAPIIRMIIEGWSNAPEYAGGGKILAQNLSLTNGAPEVASVGTLKDWNFSNALEVGLWTKLDTFLEVRQVSEFQPDGRLHLEFKNSDYNAIVLELSPEWEYAQLQNGTISETRGRSCTTTGRRPPECEEISIEGQSSRIVTVRLEGGVGEDRDKPILLIVPVSEVQQIYPGSPFYKVEDYSLVISGSGFDASVATEPVTIAVKRIQEGSGCSTEDLGLIETLDLEEEYLPVVVASENGAADVPLEALKAQAVASRTFALYKMQYEPRSASFDVCDTEADQVYNPSMVVRPEVQRSVEETRDIVAKWNGEAIAAFFVKGDEASGTAQFVTVNEGKSGSDVTPTALGSPTNPHNRGAMSQDRANELAAQGWDYQRILRYFYGSDLEFSSEPR